MLKSKKIPFPTVKFVFISWRCCPKVSPRLDLVSLVPGSSVFFMQCYNIRAESNRPVHIFGTVR